MRLIWIFLLGASMILNACSAIDHAQKKYRTTSWSSSEPLSIPYDIRLKQFEKDNLVVNPSFEADLVFKDTTGNAARSKGWETVGRNVTWVDHESADLSLIHI